MEPPFEIGSGGKVTLMKTDDDKRFTRDSVINSRGFMVERKSERKWHDCKYCHEHAPTFILTETWVGNPPKVAQTTRCCWQCGSGLEILFSEAYPNERADAQKDGQR